ncbi:MAG: prepilin-type N-terminal cleavage/methylation domain-containing protein [Candidatus Omnitrophica bacterium]|nr:prepilin-type N-terminal cleavage/methylation domain-containing protein [Candidatus Omnitrophota bacterium]
MDKSKPIAGPRHRRGFTLVELLVVIAIILILVAIALPNFLTAVTRSNVAKSYAEMRSLGGALEMYFVDHKAYPQAALVRRELSVLLEPVPYIEELPRDPFDGDGRPRSYDYGAREIDHPTRWVLVGVGPDRNRTTGHDDMEFYPGYTPLLFIGLQPKPNAPEYWDYMTYSPTNGTISRGDLYVTSDAQMAGNSSG